MISFILTLMSFVILFLHWSYIAFRDRNRSMKASDARLAFNFRDVTSEIALMSDGEFLQRLRGLGETDVAHLHSTLSSLVAVFLKKQPGVRFLNQRLIPGVAFEVWAPEETTLKVLKEVGDGRAALQLEKNALGRSLLA